MRRRGLVLAITLALAVLALAADVSPPVLAPFPSIAGTAAHAGSLLANGNRPPDVVFPAGGCSGSVCLARDVARWQDLPFTPPITCSAAGGQCRLRVDVYAPTAGGPWPLVVVVPGGPDVPSHYRYLQDLAIPLAAQGTVVMAVGWRMRASDGGGYPESFADLACAIGVARRIGPAYGGSAARVTLAAHSLGAWPAEVVALTASEFVPAPGSCDPTAGSLRPDAFVGIDGAPWKEFDRRLGSDYLVGMLGGDRTSRPEAWAAVDPYALMESGPDPSHPVRFLLVHGSDDTLILPALSQALSDALNAAGWGSRVVIVPSAGHGSVLGAVETVEAIAGFARQP